MLRVHEHYLISCYVPANFKAIFRPKGGCYAVTLSNESKQKGNFAQQQQDISQLIHKLCKNANVPDTCQHKLESLCNTCEDIFIQGTRPLAKTTLTKFKIKLSEYSRPISCPSRTVSHIKRQQIKQIVDMALLMEQLFPANQNGRQLWS